MKYIIFEWLGTPAPVLFPDFISHDDFKGYRPTSAGFCKINAKGEVETYGESNTLRLRPKEDDASLIEMMLKPDEDRRPNFDNADWLKEMCKDTNPPTK